MGLGRELVNSHARDIARSVVKDDGGSPPPPVTGVVWDGAISANGYITLNPEKTIATFAVPGGGVFSAVKSATNLPDTNKRILAFKFNGGNGACFASVGVANSSLDVDNLFGTLFGNGIFMGGQAEDGGGQYNAAGKDFSGDLFPVEPETNARNGDVIVLIIDGLNWQFFLNNTRQTNIRLYPEGGDFDPTFVEIFVGGGTIGGGNGAVTCQLLSTKAEIEAENISSHWFPAGTQTFGGAAIAANIGTKIAWVNPTAGASVMVNGRLSNGGADCDFHELAGSSFSGGSSSFSLATITDWVAQEFEIISEDVSGTYTAEFRLSDYESPGNELRLDYNHNSGAPYFEVIGSLTGQVPVSGLSAGDLIGIAYNRSTGAWFVYYKPNGGGEITVDSGTLVSPLVNEALFNNQFNNGDPTNGIVLGLKQGGDYGITLYPGTSETILGESI